MTDNTVDLFTKKTLTELEGDKLKSEDEKKQSMIDYIKESCDNLVSLAEEGNLECVAIGCYSSSSPPSWGYKTDNVDNLYKLYYGCDELKDSLIYQITEGTFIDEID